VRWRRRTSPTQHAVGDLLPRVDLPDVLLEVAGWTGFLAEFTHVSESAARAEDLGVSICADLVAEACNIGLEPVVQADNPALSRARLSWVDQNYVRGETITAATPVSSTPKASSRSPKPGAAGKLPPPTGCASLSPSAR
jgi:hypothetical protein